MRRVIAIVIVLFVVLSSCGRLKLYNQDRGDVLASVGDNKLYKEDIAKLVTEGMSESDSASMVDLYIDNWVKTELKVQAAEIALSQDEESIDALVADYRHSLMIHKYEENVMANQLDTLVTDKQIEDYYDENRDYFRLTGPIVKAVVVRLPKQLRLGVKFENLFREGTDSSREEFKAICLKNNYKYEDFDGQWTDFAAVIMHLPFTDKQFDNFLKTKKYYEIEQGEYKYMMSIISYRPTGDYSPIELQKVNIKKVIMNLRRVKLIRMIEENLLKEALAQKTVQINRK